MRNKTSMAERKERAIYNAPVTLYFNASSEAFCNFSCPFPVKSITFSCPVHTPINSNFTWALNSDIVNSEVGYVYGYNANSLYRDPVKFVFDNERPVNGRFRFNLRTLPSYFGASVQDVTVYLAMMITCESY